MQTNGHKFLICWIFIKWMGCDVHKSENVQFIFGCMGEIADCRYFPDVGELWSDIDWLLKKVISRDKCQGPVMICCGQAERQGVREVGVSLYWSVPTPGYNTPTPSYTHRAPDWPLVKQELRFLAPGCIIECFKRLNSGDVHRCKGQGVGVLNQLWYEL